MATPLKRKAADIATSATKKPKANASITSFFSSPSAPAKPTNQVAAASTASAPPSSSAAAPSSPTAAPSSASTVKDDTSPKPSQSAASADTTNNSTTTPATNPTAPAASIFTKGVSTAANPPGSSSAPAIKFDKAAWVAKLTAEQKDLLALEIQYLHESWLAHLKDEVTSNGFLELKRFLKKEHQSGKQIFPPAPDVYSWSRHTPLNTVKVVILGQDPYHNVNQAHGLCFSVRPPTPAPPSLANMYKLLQKEYPSTFRPPPNKGGLLTPWADRGVLLLNTCLTVRAHEANSHANKGWEKFTQKVIDIVAKQRTRGVVFLAWGTPAQKRCTGINQQKHCVLKSVHPSPLSAARGFFDCGHFRKTNEWLKERYGEQGEIDWNLDVAPEKAGV